MSDESKCGICGEPMPAGEQAFKFHGYSGPCPKPPLSKGTTGFTYGAMIVGGAGPDAWDKELVFVADDFMDAAGIATARAEEMCGQVVSVQQSD